MNARQLKVEPMGERFGEPVCKTMIRLKGRWLKEAGFDPGTQIEVVIERPGRLVIQQAHPALSDTRS